MGIENTAKTPRPEWVLGGDPESIERQEAQGQAQLVTSSQLPTRGLAAEDCARLQIRIVGSSVGDDLFTDVVLPPDLTIRATGHSMWTELVDTDGQIVASIFYKAAFYDRRAFITFNEA